MRDPKRIKPMLKLLKKLWKQNPDFRLGQLMYLANRNAEDKGDIFYLEDSELIIILQTLVDRGHGNNNA